jgi:SSS family solute:Na+ symporter
MNSGLHWIDGLILAVYAGSMVYLGWWHSRGQKTTDEYFVGNRAMNPLLIGISLFATLFSTISYLTSPGEVLRHGPVVPLIGILTIPFYYYLVGHLMAPVYMRHRGTSAYALLETQLGLSARLMGASMFVLLRLMWMSVMIYMACKALLVMLSWDDSWLPFVALATGGIAIFYASLGGLRAVVITDTFQFTLLFGGAWLVIAMVSWEVGGVGWFPSSWNPSWDTQPIFSFNFTERVTVFGSVLNGILWWVCTAGGDQTAIQRFMATGNASAARRSFLINSIAGGGVSVVLTLVGFALLFYYQSDSSLLPPGKTIAENADALFPYFISHHLPIGLSGLVLAGMFAAAMSSVDSGINSITAVVTSDFVDRFRSAPLSETARVQFARVLAASVGLVVVMTSSVVIDMIPGNFLEMTYRTFGLLVTPMFLLFVFALFIPQGNQWGAIGGSLTGFSTAFIISYWNIFTGLPALSFQWIMPASLLSGCLVGFVISLLTGGRRPAIGLPPSGAISDDSPFLDQPPAD